MGYVILVILIGVSFGVGWFWSKARIMKALEQSIDNDLQEEVMKAIAKNKNLMERIKEALK
jgi:uncharacterized membrane protein YvbJ